MKIVNIDNEIDNFNNVFKITDFEHFFNIYKDDLSKYKYNLNSNLYLDISDESCSHYRIWHDSHWPLISYNIYNTPRLVWLLMKLNKVKAEDVFKIRKAGENILYLPILTVLRIIDKIY